MPAITAQPIEVVSCRLVRTDGTIVASFYESSKLVIDGWHRIAKANRLLIEVLPIVILTEEETLAIMRGAGKRSLARKARIREKIKP